MVSSAMLRRLIRSTRALVQMVLTLAGVACLLAPAPAWAAKNSVGVELPQDAAPSGKQTIRVMGREGTYLDYTKTTWKRQWEPALVQEPLTRRNH